MAEENAMTKSEILDKILEILNELHKRMDDIESEGERLDERANRLMRHDRKPRKNAGRRNDVDDFPSDGLTKEEQDCIHRTTHEAEMDEMPGHRSDSVDSLVADVRARVRADGLTDGDVMQRFEAAQIKAQAAADRWSFDVERWTQNEKLTDYRLRLLKPFVKHSPEWRGANLREVARAGALDGVENQIYDSAIRAATSNGTFKNSLHAVKMRDQSGRDVTKYFGDPEACWGPFKLPARKVTGFNTHFDHHTSLPVGTPRMPGA
jgi:hypothetical protein